MPSMADRVFDNTLIMSQIVSYMTQKDLVSMNRTCKKGWTYAVKAIWRVPVLQLIDEFRAFVEAVSKPPTFPIPGCSVYGGLVRVIDLSLLNGRWERVGYNHLSQILRSCHHIHTLNINLCQYITGDEFKRLFSENPHICRSLTALDIGETQFSDRVIEDVVRMLPNLKSLGLSETATTNRTMDVIAECLPGLEDLDISQCEDVDDDGVARMIEKCKKLKHIDVDGCPMIQDYDPISHLNATWDWESDYESATGDEFDVYDEMYDEMYPEDGPYASGDSRGMQSDGGDSSNGGASGPEGL